MLTRLDILAAVLWLMDLLFLAVMGFSNLYSPLVWVVGVVFPSVIAYVAGCWLFRADRRLPDTSKEDLQTSRTEKKD